MMLVRILFVLTVLCLGTPPGAEAVRVFAAASLRDVLEDVRIRMPQHDIRISYAGSGAIARQLANKAPADLVILANAKWMDWLVDDGVIPKDNVTIVASNRLVLVGPKAAPPIANLTVHNLQERLHGGRLAIGQTDSVPAGIYARQWMQQTGLWSALAPHLAETENVRAALALVTRNEAPLGVVYASDAHAAPDLAVLYQIPPKTHDPIIYPMALLSDTDAAHGLSEFLLSAIGQEIFKAHGFLTQKDDP